MLEIILESLNILWMDGKSNLLGSVGGKLAAIIIPLAALGWAIFVYFFPSEPKNHKDRVIQQESETTPIRPQEKDKSPQTSKTEKAPENLQTLNRADVSVRNSENVIIENTAKNSDIENNVSGNGNNIVNAQDVSADNGSTVLVGSDNNRVNSSASDAPVQKVLRRNFVEDVQPSSIDVPDQQ